MIFRTTNRFQVAIGSLRIVLTVKSEHDDCVRDLWVMDSS